MIIIIILIAALIIALLARRHMQKLFEKYHANYEEESNVKADILDEKDSIKQAEEIIRKRKRLTRSVKLSLSGIRSTHGRLVPIL